MAQTRLQVPKFRNVPARECTQLGLFDIAAERFALSLQSELQIVAANPSISVPSDKRAAMAVEPTDVRTVDLRARAPEDHWLMRVMFASRESGA